MLNSLQTADLIIVYDGDCFFCANYVRLQKIKNNIGNISLLDARTNPQITIILFKLQMNINEGMAALYKEKWYFGPECMSLLSHLSDSKSFKGWIWSLLFNNKKFTALVYPFFRFIRNIVLALRGSKQIDIDE